MAAAGALGLGLRALLPGKQLWSLADSRDELPPHPGRLDRLLHRGNSLHSLYNPLRPRRHCSLLRTGCDGRASQAPAAGPCLICPGCRKLRGCLRTNPWHDYSSAFDRPTKHERHWRVVHRSSMLKNLTTDRSAWLRGQSARNVRAVVSTAVPISVALGELPDWLASGYRAPPTQAWDGIAYRKLGLAGTDADWQVHWQGVRSRLHVADGPAWIAVMYADWQEASAPPPTRSSRWPSGMTTSPEFSSTPGTSPGPRISMSPGVHWPREFGKPASCWRWPAGSIVALSPL